MLYEEIKKKAYLGVLIYEHITDNVVLRNNKAKPKVNQLWFFGNNF